jgi:hypothetical protein
MKAREGSLASSFERLGERPGEPGGAGGAGEPSAPLPAHPAAFRGLRYGEDRLHLLVRDPRRVFALWEVSEPLARRAAAIASERGAALRLSLAIECADRPGSDPETIRVPLPDALAGEGWYVDLPRGGGHCRAHLGLELPEGFEPLLTSRWMPVPPEGPCRETGTWPVDEVRRAWLDRETERLRGRVVAPLPSSASRYLASPPVPKP